MTKNEKVVFKYIAYWFVISVALTVFSIWGAGKVADYRIAKCHGQCATGNSTERHDCKKMCDKLTVCPTYGAD